jgi:predicted kinase
MLTVITGPPCAGKSTYAETNAKQGDIIIDLDRIALAISHPTTKHHHYPTHIRTAARHIRRAAIQTAIAHHHTGGTAWVVDARPGTTNRMAYKRAGATFINLDAPLPLLLQRAQNQRPPHIINTIKTWHAPKTDE